MTLLLPPPWRPGSRDKASLTALGIPLTGQVQALELPVVLEYPTSPGKKELKTGRGAFCIGSDTHGFCHTSTLFL